MEEEKKGERNCSPCMEEGNSGKKPLALDWNVVLGRTDEEPPELVIDKKKKKNMGPPKPSPMSIDSSTKDEFTTMSDHQLEDAIRRARSSFQLMRKLPDNGVKFQVRLKSLEEEQRRREVQRTQMDTVERWDSARSARSDTIGASGGFRQENICKSSEVQSQSGFASLFCKKLEGNTDCRVHAFDEELSTLGNCNGLKARSNGGFSSTGRQKAQSSSRKRSFQCVSNLSRSGNKSQNPDKYASSNVHQRGHKGRAAIVHPFHQEGEIFSSFLSTKKDTCKVLPSNDARRAKGQTVNLVDEDETEHFEKVEQASCIKGTASIDYPSRDDPESVLICYKDLSCLAPEGFLTSPIMNFYIRYIWLQASATRVCDYHFFNTFFYWKLKQAISKKQIDKESFFGKFRRWWKGINLFQKSYVLIPIHEDLHWSLVIICIPDKEDESGPIILHLDSLGLHHSKSIFSNIKSYLKEEWNYMHSQVDPSDLPIPERIWEHLPRRIDEKRIMVPQQRNDYDCGLFVLFFMERFIKEAPERLKKKDLEMFGKQWFRPEEASGLRVIIRKLLLDKFLAASENTSAGTSP